MTISDDDSPPVRRPHVFETERLIGREMSRRDLDFIASLLADPEVMRHYPKCYSRSEAAGWVDRQVARYAEDGHGLWLVLERESLEPVGQVGLLIQEVEGEREPEIGYLIHRPFWRRGYASEAALATRDLAFGTFGYDRVVSLIRPENLPSQGVAGRLGMTPARSAVFAGLEHLVFSVSRHGGRG